MNRRNAIAVSALTVAATVGLLVAGPLDPPSGPISPTAKPLSEIEPRTAISAANTPGDADSLFKITQPGSYYLTGNIAGVPGKHGIEIASSGVTLDLGGFELRGGASTLDGINVSAFRGRNITVRNGSLRYWNDCGLECEDNAGHPPVVALIGLNASLNTRDGLSVDGWSRVEGCQATENGGNGIVSGGNTVVIDCVASLNSADGFVGNRATTLIGCNASTNTGRGFYTAIGSLLRGCVADNNGIGFVSQGTAFESCVAHDNSAAGFDLFTACTVTDSHAYRNGTTGIDASTSSTVSNCTAGDNSGAGIIAGTGTLVIACTANENDSTGITLGSGAQAINCTVVNNLGVGISSTSNTLIRGNNVINNGGTTATNANIRLTGSDSRLEGNNVTDGPIGIEVTLSGNIITGNTASGNTLNWSVVAGNFCLVVLATPHAAAISGDSGGASPGSTNPSANYTY